ncbi:MAG: DUF2809 domain-containing protein [Oscillospiraceae bacterium]|nr:DUF2809 domain-containing protein [Oscillospiraceae bacterium]
MSRKNKLRIVYAFITVLLLAVEVMIALFVHDRFIRPYFGDMLVVVVIYTFVRIFIPEKHRLLPLFVFIFSAGVEVLQYFEIVQRLGLGGNIFLRTLLGSTFDPKDIACYAVGCVVLGIYEILSYIKSNTK